MPKASREIVSMQYPQCSHICFKLVTTMRILTEELFFVATCRY